MPIETGSMIVAMVPDRVLSLALLNAKGGGFQCFPKVYLPFIVLWNVLICFYDVNCINDW